MVSMIFLIVSPPSLNYSIKFADFVIDVDLIRQKKVSSWQMKNLDNAFSFDETSQSLLLSPIETIVSSGYHLLHHTIGVQQVGNQAAPASLGDAIP